MTRARQLLALMVSLALGFASGFWVARAVLPAHVQRVVETVEQVRTLVVRERVEAERQAQATERIVERRVAVPCPTCAAKGLPAPAACGAGERQTKAVAGRAIIEERLVERALSTSERLKFEGLSHVGEASTSEHHAERTQAASLPRWRLGVLAGWSWSDAEPVYGISAGARLLGPVELGAWAISSTSLHGAAGLSLALRF